MPRFCHDGIDGEDPAAIVCAGCLSRHHGACWREGDRRCATCGGQRALKRAEPDVAVAPAELTLLQKGLPRQAVERLAGRAGVSREHAQEALLEAAAGELQRRASGLPAPALVAIVAIVMVMLVPILAILFGA